MNKPIIATTLSGLFIKSEPWKKAHILWFERAAKELNDFSVKEFAYKDPYFLFVDKVMQRLYPSLSDKQRTIKARKMFFECVCRLISMENSKYKNKGVVEYFNELKKKYRLALITTNTKTSIDIILSLTKLRGLFNIIEYSNEDEKDDKVTVFERFLENYGKLSIYIGGDRKDSFDYCKKNNIPCIFANLEGDEDLDNVDTVHNLEELKKKLEIIGIKNE